MFLQDLIYKQRTFSTIKVYLAAIAACYLGFNGWAVSQHPLICRFMKGVCRRPPVSRSLLPPWDLVVVLEGLKDPPYEQLPGTYLKFVSLEAVLLLALASAKHVSDIHALSVHPSCAKFFSRAASMILKPNPTFLPEEVCLCSPIDRAAFSALSEDQQSHALCPVRAVCAYEDRMASVNRSDQLFVSWGGPYWYKPITKQRLADWVV